MENRSNVVFDINGRDRKYFDLAMQLAVGPDPKDTVKAFYVDEDKNRIVLLWHVEPKSSAFLTPLNAEEVGAQVWAWLKTRTPSEEEVDHDGDNSKGWRMYTEGYWGHVEPFGPYAIVAIEPVWIEYGK